MQNFTIFDMIIVSITILLGLKGLFRGFIKEIFGLVGIIGGIFVASRMTLDIGNAIAPILALENQATIKLIGFVLGLIGFWAIVYVVGVILSKIFQVSGLGIFDRILGFIFGSAKIFLIFSVIIYSLFQIQSFKDLMNKKAAGSITYPFLIQTGSFIVKLDASDFVKKVEEHMAPDDVVEEENMIKEKSFTEEVKDTVKEIKKTTLESGTAVIDTVKKTVSDNTNKIVDEIENTSSQITNENINSETNKVTEEIKEGN